MLVKVERLVATGDTEPAKLRTMRTLWAWIALEVPWLHSQDPLLDLPCSGDL